MMKKLMKRIAHIFLGILLAILLCVAFIIMTPTGLRLAVSIATQFIPGRLTIKTINGSLIKKIELTDFQYKNESVSIEISQLNFHWLPIALLSKHLDITKLYVNDAEIKYTTSTSTPKKPDETKTVKTEPFNLKKFEIPLPLQVSLSNVELQNIRLQQDKQPATILNHLALSAKTEDNQLIIKKLDATTGPYKLYLSGNMQFKYPFNTKINLQTITELPGSYPIHTHINLTGDLEKQLAFKAEIKQPFLAHITGTLENPIDAGPINVSGEWKNLILPFDITQNIVSQQGKLSITGKLSDYNVMINSDLAGAMIPAGHWILQGQGSLKQLDLKKIDANILHGQLSGYARTNWENNLTWQTALTIRHINPGIKWPNWEGDINAHITSTGKIADQSRQINVQLQQLSGNLNQNRLSGHFLLHANNEEITIPASTIHLGKDYLFLSGNLLENWNFKWKINAPNIAAIIPHMTGTIHSQGSLTGKSALPSIQGNLFIKDLNAEPLKIKSVTSKFQLHFNAQQNSTVALHLNQLHYANYHLHQFNFNLSGPLENHDINLHFKTEHANINAFVKAQIQNQLKQFTLHKLDMQSAVFGNWHLQAPVTLALSKQIINLSPFNWQSNTGSISGQFNQEENSAWSGVLKINRLPTQIFTAFLPQGLTLESHLNANIDLARDLDGKIQGSAAIGTTSGNLVYQNKIKKTLPFKNAQFNLQLSGTGLNSQCVINTQQQTPVDIAINLPNYSGKGFPDSSQSLKGHIKLNFDDLAFLADVIPSIEHLRGHISSHLNLAGTIKKPTILGQLEAKNGEVKITDLGIFLRNIDLNLTGTRLGKLNLDGGLYSGGHKLTIQGETSIHDSTFPSSYEIKGEDIQLMNTSEYKITASPDLKITYNKPKLKITGLVNVNHASITPKDFTSTVTLPSNTIIIKGNEDLNEPSLMDVYTKLKLNFGKNIYFTYAGLNAQIGGELTIDSSPKQLTTGTGEIKILNGKFDAYGTKLLIEKGSIIYTGGPIDDPNLDIQATKTVKHYVTASGAAGPGQIPTTSAGLQDVTVGLRVTGDAKKPVMKLFSEPPGMSESDILSYLVLGAPANAASGSQAQLLMKAAQSTSSVGNLSNNIKDTFGLSEVGFESDTVLDSDNKPQQNTSFVVGKYLTPRLYMSYSVGILVPINVLMVRYILSHRWSVQTESSSQENGGDIFYTIQTN